MAILEFLSFRFAHGTNEDSFTDGKRPTACSQPPLATLARRAIVGPTLAHKYKKGFGQGISESKVTRILQEHLKIEP